MAKRLTELYWTGFIWLGDSWEVILTTPQLCKENWFRVERGRAAAICCFAEKRIYIDAGSTEDDIGESLQHELFHVARGDHADWQDDHRFFMRTSPMVWSMFKAMKAAPLPPLPDGWKKLQRSSRAWKNKREWSE